MKKIITAILVLSFVFSLAGCVVSNPLKKSELTQISSICESNGYVQGYSAANTISGWYEIYPNENNSLLAIPSDQISGTFGQHYRNTAECLAASKTVNLDPGQYRFWLSYAAFSDSVMSNNSYTFADDRLNRNVDERYAKYCYSYKTDTVSVYLQPDISAIYYDSQIINWYLWITVKTDSSVLQITVISPADTLLTDRSFISDVTNVLGYDVTPVFTEIEQHLALVSEGNV